MNDAAMLMIMAPAGIVGLGIVSAAMLKGWSGWLEVQRLELEGKERNAVGSRSGGRIDLAGLKERVRRLEAIAAGLDS